MLQVAAARIRLRAKKIAHPSEACRAEGVAKWEMDLFGGIEYERHILIERRRKPTYERYGLVKLDGSVAEPETVSSVSGV